MLGLEAVRPAKRPLDGSPRDATLVADLVVDRADHANLAHEVVADRALGSHHGAALGQLLDEVLPQDAWRLVEPRRGRMQEVQREQPAGPKVRRDPGERRLLLVPSEQVPEAAHGEHDQVEGRAIDLERGELALEQAAASQDLRARSSNLVSREGEHRGGRVHPRHGMASSRERHEHAPGPAGELQYAASLSFGELHVQGKVLLEGEGVVEGGKLRIDPRLMVAKESGGRGRAMRRRVPAHSLLVPGPIPGETLRLACATEQDLESAVLSAPTLCSDVPVRFGEVDREGGATARKIGILTGGGDCPGLNAAIRAVVRKGINVHGLSVLGFRNGWAGVLEPNWLELTAGNTGGLLHRGGTILGTSRVDVFEHPRGVELLRENMQRLELEGLIVTGGDGTLRGAAKLTAEGINLIGIPKTIDNDVPGTDFTIGFDTAVQIATEAIDRLHSTAESHHRVMVVEVMGRGSGWIALLAGLAGGADAILIPECPFDIHDVSAHLTHRRQTGHDFSIVVVAEGAIPANADFPMPQYEMDRFHRAKLGGISGVVAQEITRVTGYETQVTILGHVQRGGSPTAPDRILATRLGAAAVDLAAAGRWRRMVGVRGTSVRDVELDEALGPSKPAPIELFELAEVFFG